MTRKQFIILSTVSCVLGFLFPFFLIPNENLTSILFLSFAALGTIATILTLIVAIILYQKFTIDYLVVERQTNKVLELIDILKGYTVSIHTGKVIIFSRFVIDEQSYFNTPFIREALGDALITRKDDFDNFVQKILNIGNSYWMPNEIREKLEFLRITGFYPVEKKDLNNFSRLSFGQTVNDEDEWLKIIASLKTVHTTVENPIKLEDAELLLNDYITSKNSLVAEIENWIATKSSIKIKFDMDLPNQQNLHVENKTT
jgi:hypothetical protein